MRNVLKNNVVLVSIANELYLHTAINDQVDMSFINTRLDNFVR